MTNDFFGKTIHGDITHYTEGLAEQHDPIEFLNLLDALVSLDHVEAVRWHQYTPYFNDGEACTFNVYEPEVLLDVSDEDDEDGDASDNFLSAYYLYQYGEGSTWEERNQKRTYTYKGIDTKAIYDALIALSSVTQHHEAILSKKFGDPAVVTYDGDSFDVEFYDHD